MFTLHSSVIDFKFYAPSTNNNKARILSLATASDDEDEATTYMDNGILVERKVVDTDEQDMPAAAASKSRSFPKKNTWTAHNVTEYLFFNNMGHLEITEESVAHTYQAYTTLLCNAHKQLRENYMMLAEQAFGGSAAMNQGMPPPLPLKVDPMKTNTL